MEISSEHHAQLFIVLQFVLYNSFVYCNIQGPFAKCLGSPCYSELELCGDAVMSLFRSTSLGNQCTSYNILPTS
jgi:hypothetical protein